MRTETEIVDELRERKIMQRATLLEERAELERRRALTADNFEVTKANLDQIQMSTDAEFEYQIKCIDLRIAEIGATPDPAPLVSEPEPEQPSEPEETVESHAAVIVGIEKKAA